MCENMNDKKQDLFPAWLPKHRIEDGGDGIFLVFTEHFEKATENDITAHYFRIFEDVQWCPEPDAHGADATAVLNCFYPKFTQQK